MLNSSAGSSLPPDSWWQTVGWCFILAALYHVSASDDEEPKLWLGRTWSNYVLSFPHQSSIGEKSDFPLESNVRYTVQTGKVVLLGSRIWRTTGCFAQIFPWQLATSRGPIETRLSVTYL